MAGYRLAFSIKWKEKAIESQKQRSKAGYRLKWTEKTRHGLDRSQFRFNENRLPATNLKFLLKCWRFWNSCQSCWNRKQMVGAKKWSKMEPIVENNLTTICWSNMETYVWPLDDFYKIVEATIFFSLCVAKRPNQVISPVTGCIRRLPAIVL